MTITQDTLTNSPATLTPGVPCVTLCELCTETVRSPFRPVRQDGQWADIADLPYPVAMARIERAGTVTHLVGTIAEGVTHHCYVCREKALGGTFALSQYSAH